jgi:crotonobetainyl-CoA:carnitine CoA-transferase CaiB-like acyl-CoA transferase
MSQLEGIRILDFTIWRPGPYATQLLAELGADVLKVEPPGGDPMRSYPGIFDALSANKRSIALDLKNDEHRRRALELVADADVVVESYRPGVADRLGIGYDAVRAVNPTVVYCSVSGMGQIGDLATAPGHDVNYQAWSGALAPEGNDPVSAAVPIADLAGGLAGAYAVCAALVRRARTGEGERIDAAMGDVLATWTGAVTPEPEGADPDTRGVPGYGTFPTRDGGFVALGIITEDHFWRALCAVLGLHEFGTLGFLDRLGRADELQPEIATRIAARDRDECVAALLAAGAPAAPVLNRTEMLALPHFRTRGAVTPDGARVGHLVRFVADPARPPDHAPAVDEHAGTGFSPRL